jgi:hypothetical protein
MDANHSLFLDSMGKVTRSESKSLLQPEDQALTSILTKFAFTNEDIMRKFVHAQFSNFIDREKPYIGLNQNSDALKPLIPSLNMSGLS